MTNLRRSQRTPELRRDNILFGALLKSAKFRSLVTSGLKTFREHDILRPGQHRLTVTVTVRGTSDVQAQTTVIMSYYQGKLLKFPQIWDIVSAEDWKVSGT